MRPRGPAFHSTPSLTSRLFSTASRGYAFFCSRLRNSVENTRAANRLPFGSGKQTVRAIHIPTLRVRLSSCPYHWVLGRKSRTGGATEQPPAIVFPNQSDR